MPLPGCYAAERRHSNHGQTPSESAESLGHWIQTPHQVTGRRSYAASSKHSSGACCHRILGKCWKQRTCQHQGALGPQNYAAKRRHSSAPVTLQWAPRKRGNTWLLADSAASCRGAMLRPRGITPHRRRSRRVRVLPETAELCSFSESGDARVMLLAGGIVPLGTGPLRALKCLTATVVPGSNPATGPGAMPPASRHSDAASFGTGDGAHPISVDCYPMADHELRDAASALGFACARSSTRPVDLSASSRTHHEDCPGWTTLVSSRSLRNLRNSVSLLILKGDFVPRPA